MGTCAKCGVQACSAEPGSKRYPSDCPTTAGADLIDEVEAIYEHDPETRRLLIASAQTEAAGYCRETRAEEVMSFARRIGAQRLGVAHCIGLAREAALFEDILKAHGFEVHSICCKVGSTPKEQVGLKDEEKVHPGQYEPVCSPVAQAMWLNRLGTQLNVVIGLCVGHDSLFFRNSDAPVTVLVVKDRVTGHNPVAALYTSHSYYKRLKGD
jgi:uncharacterized metal-binding protein